MLRRGRTRSISASRGLLAATAAVCIGLVVALVLVGLAVVPGLLTGGVPSIAVINSSSDGGLVTFSWDDPGLESDDRYLVQIEEGESRVQRETAVSVDAIPGTEACVTVRVQSGQELSAPTRTCVGVADGVD